VRTDEGEGAMAEQPAINRVILKAAKSFMSHRLVHGRRD
jgi:hypothetical protein